MRLLVDTAVTVPVNICPLTDDGDFKTRETSVAYNASGMDLVWNFVTPAGVQTQTAVTPTDTGGVYDWTNVGDGMYKIEIPASGGGTINNDTEGYGWFSGFATGVLPWVGPIIEFAPANIVNSLTIGSDKLQTDAVEISSDTTAADNLETAFDDTAGPVPWLGIVDQGTAQSASSTGVVLRSAAAFADDTLIGCVIGAFGSTQGYWQFRQITDNALSGDTVTVDTWAVTPSGTITYKIFGSPPASATLLPGVDVTNWKGATAPAMTGDAYALVRGLVMANGTIGSTGNDTTHIHLTGLTYGNDEINNWLLVIRDVSEGEYHSRWVEDWVLSSALATVATLPFTPQNATDTYWLLPIRQDVTGGSGLDAAGVRAAVGLASANLDTQLGDLPTNSELATALASADDAVLTAVDALPTNSELATALAAADDAVLAAIAALNNLSSAQVTTAVTTLMTTHGLTASRTGTAQAGAAGTITLDASASATDDIYNGMLARIVSGTGAGQWRPIYDYVGSTKVAHVKPNWTTTPDNTSVFAVTSCAAADFQLFEGKNTLSGSDRFTGL